MNRDCTDELVARTRAASASRTPLRIVGGDTKRFLGRPVAGEALEVGLHRGILRHDPAELVLTARAGTPMVEVEASLAAHGQRLPFEPPHFGARATLGGTVACGLAGPARAWSGALRDFVLGARVLTGDGRVLRFGGEVMKNVAGYDVARLMAGGFGVLGVLLDVSLKLLPVPQYERTLALELQEDAALGRLAELSRAVLPLTAGAWVDGRLYLRFEGSAATTWSGALAARHSARRSNSGQAYASRHTHSLRAATRYGVARCHRWHRRCPSPAHRSSSGTGSSAGIARRETTCSGWPPLPGGSRRCSVRHPTGRNGSRRSRLPCFGCTRVLSACSIRPAC